jgi:hypothetical protein
MPKFDVKNELIDAIRDKGEDVNQFANHAIESALKPRSTRIRTSSTDSCFLDEHCSNM